MDEDIVADDDHVLEPVQEDFVLRGDAIAHRLVQFVVIHSIVIGRIDAVAHDRLTSADPAEHAQRLGLALQRFEEDLFVIAEQEARVRPVQRQTTQRLDHGGGGGAAIDEVAQEDQRRLRRTARGVIGRDIDKQLVEQVRAAVNVADGIDAFAGGYEGSRNGRGTPCIEQLLEHDILSVEQGGR